MLLFPFSQSQMERLPQLNWIYNLKKCRSPSIYWVGLSTHLFLQL